MLVAGIQQRDSVMHVYVLFPILFHYRFYCKILKIVSCVTLMVLIRDISLRGDGEGPVTRNAGAGGRGLLAGRRPKETNHAQLTSSCLAAHTCFFFSRLLFFFLEVKFT